MTTPDQKAPVREAPGERLRLLEGLPRMAYRCRLDRDWTMEYVSGGCRDLTHRIRRLDGSERRVWEQGRAMPGDADTSSRGSSWT